MAAPTTITVSGTYITPLNTPSSGYVSFKPVVRAVNNLNVIPLETQNFVLNGSGVLSAVVVNLANYTVTEYIDGTPAKSYNLPGTANVDLNTITVT